MRGVQLLGIILTDKRHSKFELLSMWRGSSLVTFHSTCSLERL